MFEEFHNSTSHSEHREHSEQTYSPNTLVRSLSIKLCDNKANKIPMDIATHIETIAIEPTEYNPMRPTYTCHESNFLLGGVSYPSGLYWHGIINSRNGQTDLDLYVCTPLKLICTTASQELDSHGCRISLRDNQCVWHEWTIPMSIINSRDSLLNGLLDLGLTYEPKQTHHILKYLMRFDRQEPLPHILSTKQIGWHENSYVLPDEVIGPESVAYQSTETESSGFYINGTVLDWYKHVGKYCQNNPLLQLSVCLALAGPMLKLLDMHQGFGLHLMGDSSIGKSTCLEVANSVWSSKETLRSWSSTSNGAEAVMASRNDNLLILDEIDEGNPHDIYKIIYKINGQGKQRANRNGGAKKIDRWAGTLLSSGERSITNKLKEVGKETNAGQEARLINLDASSKFGIFDDLHGYLDGASLSSRLKSNARKYYGTLGREFIGVLITHKNLANFPELLEEYKKSIIRDRVLQPIEMRVGVYFAVLCLVGELAADYCLEDTNKPLWQSGSATESAKLLFEKWRCDQNIGLGEDQKILRSLTSYVDRYGDSNFEPLRTHDNEYLSNPRVNDRAGWHKTTNGQRTYLFHKQGLAMAIPNFDPSRVIKALKKLGWLVDHDSNRLTKKTRTPEGSKDLYYVQIKPEDAL